jgi:hypothetical protein
LVDPSNPLPTTATVNDPVASGAACAAVLISAAYLALSVPATVVPRERTTEAVPGFAAGTRIVSDVSLTHVSGAATPLTLALYALAVKAAELAPKPLPETVTVAPEAGNTELLKPRLVGATQVTADPDPMLDEVVALLTTTFHRPLGTAFAPLGETGVVAVIMLVPARAITDTFTDCDVLSALTSETVDAVSPKLVPVIVIVVPPCVEMLDGFTPVTVGLATGVLPQAKPVRYEAS